ncbi:MAG TPA: AMP-binding protein [Actinomycetota bacterium]|nr:AMP-binding protein [Actinomycetota bacterium]
MGGDPAFLESLFASGLLGAALAPVNHRLAADGIRAVLADTEPSVLMQHGATDPTPMPGSVRHRISVAGPLEEALDFEALVAESSDEPIQGLVGMEDVCLLSHTSGTTGPPKGVMLTHANLTWNVVNFLTCADFRSDDVTVAIAPFFRVGGTGVNVLPVLFLGGTVVVPSDLSPDGILQAMDRHRVTVGFGNPDLLDALARSEVWPHVDLSSVRFVITGGAPVPERLIRAYLNRGVTLLQGYGLSEAAPLALLLDPHSALSRVGSAGRPPLLVDIRIVRPDRSVVRPGETGELLVRGPNVMAGYWRRPEATREVLSPDGWLRTGDAARSDEEGYVWIVDRVADLPLRGPARLPRRRGTGVDRPSGGGGCRGGPGPGQGGGRGGGRRGGAVGRVEGDRAGDPGVRPSAPGPHVTGCSPLTGPRGRRRRRGGRRRGRR